MNPHMNPQVFIPVTDELIYNHPEDIEGPLVPYFAGMECHNWLSIEINPDESDNKPAKARVPQVKRRQSGISHLKLAYSS